jgi:hypothetical protein
MKNLSLYILRKKDEDFILSEEEINSIHTFYISREDSHVIGRFRFLTNNLGHYACLYECEQEQFKKSHLIQVIENLKETPNSITYHLAKKFGEQFASISGGIFSDYCFSQTSPKCTDLIIKNFEGIEFDKILPRISTKGRFPPQNKIY